MSLTEADTVFCSIFTDTHINNESAFVYVFTISIFDSWPHQNKNTYTTIYIYYFKTIIIH